MDVPSLIELYAWQQVPARVGQLIKQAKPISATLRKVIKNLPVQSGYGYVFYHPENHELWAVLGDRDTQSTHNRWYNALKAIKGITRVRIESEGNPPNKDEWVMIKRANPLGLVGGSQQLMGTLTGGPSPMTNALTGALLTGGLGYGTGWLLERLFPERFVRRGALSKTLGLAGAGLGTLPAAWQYSANLRNDRDGGAFKSIFKPNQDVDYDPQLGDEMDAYWRNNNNDVRPLNGRVVQADHLVAMQEWLGDLPEISPLLERAIAGFSKEAFFPQQEPGGGGYGLRPVPMDAFNRAIWNDVRAGMTANKNPFGTKNWQGDDTQQLHTPPPVAAATTAINTGIQDMYGGKSILSPSHFIRGLATAGVDLATAHIVGGTLGALGGLQPEAQKKLQDFGLWGGLLRGTVGSMMGMR